MALNFDGQEEIAPGVNAFRFATPDGRKFYERDPMKAMQLGMPPDFANAAPKPAAPPDMRLASNAHQAPAQDNGPGFATQEELLRSKLEAPDTPAPMAAQQAEQNPQAPQRDPNAEFEDRLNAEVPLPQRYKRAAAREAGYTPESMQVSGADPEALRGLAAQYDALEERRMQVAAAQLDATEEQAANERLNARVGQMEAQDKIVAQERKVKFQEDAKRRHMAALDNEEQQVAKRTPDSDRFFKKAGSGSFFLAALMQGLGEIGAAMRKDGRNPARDIINKRIEQDIDEQVAEVAADKDAVAKQKNAYAAMLADGMDPEFAREKLRWLQGVKAESVAREAAATTASAQAQQHFLAQADEWAQENLKFKAGLIDKQDVKTSLKYDRGSAGGVYEDPKYAEKLKSAVESRNILRAERAGMTPESYETGKKAEATAAVSGANDKVPLSTALAVNEGTSNLSASERAEMDIEALLNTPGADIELSPSGWRRMQPGTEFTQGDQAADEDRYGKEGAKIRHSIGELITSTRSPALQTLSESDKRNVIDNIIGDGKPETVLRNVKRKKAEYQAQAVNIFQAMSPTEQRKILKSADERTKRMYIESLSGQREDTEPLDAQR
jgi:hypothetical protein